MEANAQNDADKAVELGLDHTTLETEIGRLRGERLPEIIVSGAHCPEAGTLSFHKSLLAKKLTHSEQVTLACIPKVLLIVSMLKKTQWFWK